MDLWSLHEKGAYNGVWYMPWHEQGNQRYYYRNRWIGGQSVRQYVGRGPIGELAAATDALRRENREAQATAWSQEQARREPSCALVRRLCEGMELLFRATLLAADYHRHARFSWRKRRVPKEQDRGRGTGGV